MALGVINLGTVVPTPSGIVTTKFRDGNDGGGAAPTAPVIGTPIPTNSTTVDIPVTDPGADGTAPIHWELEMSTTSAIAGFTVINAAASFVGDGIITQASLTASTVYWTRLARVDTLGRRSPYSAVRTFTTSATGGAAPGAPTINSVVNAGGGGATITFTAGTGTNTSYDILQGTGDGAGNPVGQGSIIAPGIAGSPYTVTGMPTTQIYFKVRGRNGVIAGAYSGSTYITLGAGGEAAGVRVSNFEGLTLGALVYVADPNHWGVIGGSPGDSAGMTIDNTHVRSGSRSAKIHVAQAVAERAECRYGATDGDYHCPTTTATVLGFQNVQVGATDWWFGWSTYVPAGFQPLYFSSNPSNSTFIMVMQMHWTRDAVDPASAGGGTGSLGVKNPWLALSIKGSEDAAREAYWTISMSKNAAQPSVDSATQPQSNYAGLVRTGWTDWVFKVRLNAANGYAYAWKEDSATTIVAGSPIAQRTGGVGYVHTDNQPYMKFGAYTGVWDNATNNLTVGANFSSVTVYDLWLDEHRWMTANAANDAAGIAAVRPR